MRFVLLLALVALFGACQADRNESPFTELEASVESDPTNANVAELLAAYTDWLRANPRPTAQRRKVLFNMTALGEQHARLESKLTALEYLVIDFPDDDQTLDRLVEISDLYDRLRRQSAINVLNNSIVKVYSDDSRVAPVKEKLQGAESSPDDIIQGLASQMFDTATLRLSQPVARQYVDACEAYALVNSGNPESAEYLHKAAETARTLGTMMRAIDLYDWILIHYPDHPRASQALFLKAFTYDSNLEDYDNARIYYQQFLEMYPEDDFASSAQFLLDNQGKDDEELLKILQEKGQQEGN